MKIKFFKKLSYKIKDFLYSYHAEFLKDFLFAAIVISGIVTLFAGATIISGGLLTFAFSHHLFYIYAGVTGMFIAGNTILHACTERKPKPYLNHHSISFSISEEERIHSILQDALAEKPTISRRKSLAIRRIQVRHQREHVHIA